jgi:hypothetical protein
MKKRGKFKMTKEQRVADKLDTGIGAPASMSYDQYKIATFAGRGAKRKGK